MKNWKKQTGVWIDSSQAIIITLFDGKENITEIKSGIENKVYHDDEGHKGTFSGSRHGFNEQKFNERSKKFDSDFIVTVWLTLYNNKTLTFIIKTSPVAFLINEDDESIESDFFSYYVALTTLYKIVNIKSTDLDINQISLLKSIIGTLKGMNVILVNNIFK